jgi:protein-S-isoprenylcysteine O-methyltransferase Ste14
MNDILFALGYGPNRWRQVWLINIFVVVTCFFLVLEQLLQVGFRLNPLLVQGTGWIAWFSWQGYFFALNRKRYLRKYKTNAYQKAFYHDILPGVSFGVSQMLRPAYFGLLTFQVNLSSVWWLLVGLLCVGAGLTLLYLGFRSIGIAGAGFLFEYRDASPPLVQQSIYAYMRHPLFAGGVVVSLGTALCFVESLPLVLALLNILVLPVYSWLEDRRLNRVFGCSYARYCSKVGGIIPRPNLLMASLLIKAKQQLAVALWISHRLRALLNRYNP